MTTTGLLFLVSTVGVLATALLGILADHVKPLAWLHGRRLVAAFVVMVVVVGGLTTWGVLLQQDSDDRPALEVTDAAVPPGQTTQATGRGFAPGEDVHLQIEVSTQGTPRVVVLKETATADSGGEFELTIGVPVAATGGQRLTATGETSGHRESTTFAVPPLTPSITLAPAAGPAGTRVEVSGGGFFPGEPVDIVLGKKPVTSTAADDRGGIRSTVRIPGSADPGTELSVTAKGRQTAGRFGTGAAAYVVTDATPTTTPPSRPPTTTPPPTRPPATTDEPDPPADPRLPRTFQGTWSGVDDSDPTLVTTVQLELSSGEVGTVIGRSVYSAAITYEGALRLEDVTPDGILVRETLQPPSTGTTEIFLSARSKNTLTYESRTTQLVLSRN